jgi:DNA-binding transcriptional ArsR family regulator
MAVMVRPLTEEAAALIAQRFRALSDPTRLRVLDFLRGHEEASVTELTEALGTSQQNLSKHLAALHAEGFVARRKKKTSTLYRISDPGVHDLCEGVCAGIESQLEELSAVLGPT